ncbi:phage tail tape measure protein [Pseudomonas fluorescens]|uniref:phage tail tape measure protein n=1 Tax=Pseudomonas fluorescens TaxID=294 RepID=UPI00203595B0|nr:phage tail tape measure protein [Pseudomonas fluorescens]
MQDNYSLAYAMATEGWGSYGEAGSKGNAHLDALAPPESFTTGSTLNALQAPLADVGLALANASQQVNSLSLSQALLRESIDTLDSTLSQFKASEVRPVNADDLVGSTPQKASASVVADRHDSQRLTQSTQVHSRDDKQSETSESQTRSAMTLGQVQILDLAAALEHSGANLSLDKTETSDSSIKAKREAYSESETRLSSTLDSASVWLESPWLDAKTAVVKFVNTHTKDSPVAADALKTANAVISPVASEAISAMWDTIKSRASGNLLDKVAPKLPPLFRDLLTDKGQGKDKPCCPGTTPLVGGSVLDTAAATLPESVGETVRKKGKARSSGRMKSRRVRLPAVDQRVSPVAPNVAGKAREVGKRRALNPHRFAEQPKLGPQLNIKGEPLGTFSVKDAAKAAPALQGNSFAASAAPLKNRSATRGGSKGLTASLSGTLAKLESVGARRLAPLRIASAAMDVVQGAQNGDLRAVGAGLGTAGGAWAGASAGAALGTLILPGIGTAVGGALGGFFGSDAGAWLGDKLGGMVDRLRSPDEVGKQLTNNTPADNRQITLSPVINISGLDPNSAQQVATMVIQTLQNQCMPMMTDALAVRRSATLTDGVA